MGDWASADPPRFFSPFMKIILGLGNPGARYEKTRHNIGWIVLDAVAERLRTEFRPGRGDYYEAQGSWRGRKVVLLKPTTYMNNSGLAARQAMRQYGVGAEDLLVLVDEIQFPVGRIKLHSAGSSGGHNGVESIIYHLEKDTFPRLRCGVGNNFGPGEMVDYVLSDFAEEEKGGLAEMIEEGKDAALLWVTEGTARSMNRINARKPAHRKEEKQEKPNGKDGDEEKPDAGFAAG